METKSVMKRIVESGGKDGIFYVLKFPGAWRLYAFPSDEFGDLWHAHAWRKYCVIDLATAWSVKVNKSTEHLEEELKPWWKGFPRGRIERVALMELTVLYGGDLGETGISRYSVQRVFEMDACKVNWIDDPHELQNSNHTAAVAQILGFNLPPP